MWSQGGDYYDIEESLGLGSGYPALVAISINKMKYAPFTGIFDKKNIELFVKTLLAGKQPLFDLRQAPKIKNVKEWDGKDKKPAEYVSLDIVYDLFIPNRNFKESHFKLMGLRQILTFLFNVMRWRYKLIICV